MQLRSIAIFLGAAAIAVTATSNISSDVPSYHFDIGGGVTTLAVPDCVPRAGDEAARAACQSITDVLRADLRFEDVRLVPEALYRDLPTFNPEAIKFDDWKAARADILVVTK